MILLIKILVITIIIPYAALLTFGAHSFGAVAFEREELYLGGAETCICLFDVYVYIYIYIYTHMIGR